MERQRAVEDTDNKNSIELYLAGMENFAVLC